MHEEPAYSIARLADDRDLDEVLAIETASFSNPWTREMLARELRHADIARVYVVRGATGGIVAFCACWFIVDELHINTLAVAVPERRRGLATMLLRFVLDEAMAAGVERATLDVRRSNTTALRLYQRLGFVVRAVRPDYYTRPDEDGLILWRDDLRAPPAHPQS